MPLLVLLGVLGLAISVMAFQSVNRQYEARVEADFHRDVDGRVAQLEQGLAQVVERLGSVGAFYLSAGQVDAQEFRDFSSGYLRQQAGLSFMAWAPAEFGADVGDDPGEGPGDLTDGVSLPLQLLEPGPVGRFDFGADLAGNRALLAALEASFQQGQVQYVVADGQLVFVMPTLDVIEWSGVALAGLPIASMREWIGLAEWQADLEVADQSTSQVILVRENPEAAGRVYETSLDVAGRIWRFRARAPHAPGTVAGAWAALNAGIAITALLGFLVLTLVGNAERANRLVRKRTRELEQAETEARHQAVRLADEVIHTNQVISSIPSLLIGIDSVGRITQWNRAVTTLSGIGAAQAVGSELPALGWEGQLDRLVGYVTACLSGAEVQHCEDLRFSTPEGCEATVGISVSPLMDSERQLIGCLVVGADITERNSMEMQLRESQRLEAVGRLAAGIAHEVNTPAQFVSDNTTFLRDAFADLLALEARYSELFESLGDRLSDEQQQLIVQARETADREYLMEEIPPALEQSLDGIKRIADIVRAMKEFSHPGGGNDREQVDFNRLINNAVTVAANEYKYDATVNTEFDESLPALSCFPRELNQVVLNLLINAAHAISDKKGDSAELGSITISTGVEGDYIQMRVSDSGTGVPEHVRDKIFEPFFTTKEVGRGSGQGLALAYSAVVDKHQGELKFETEMGVGTTFIVNLPLQKQEAAA